MMLGRRRWWWGGVTVIDVFADVGVYVVVVGVISMYVGAGVGDVVMLGPSLMPPTLLRSLPDFYVFFDGSGDGKVRPL